MEHDVPTNGGPTEDHDEFYAQTQQTPPSFMVGLDVFLDARFDLRTVRCRSTVQGWIGAQYFLIAAPTINGRPVDVMHNDPITVRYILDGVAYGFNTTFVRKVISPVQLWFLRYPSVTETRQLRRFTRLQTLIPVHIEGHEGSVLAVDLSKGGAQIDWPGCTTVSLEHPLRLSFSLPNGGEVKGLSAQVRSVRSTNYSKLIGVEFEPAEPAELTPVFEFIDDIALKRETV